MTRLRSPSSHQGQTDAGHCDTPDQKAKIPIDALRLINDFVDVMNAEQFVINDALGQVEDSPSEQQRSQQRPARPVEMSCTRSAPYDCETRNDKRMCNGVEKPIPCRVQLQV